MTNTGKFHCKNTKKEKPNMTSVTIKDYTIPMMTISNQYKHKHHLRLLLVDK